MAYLICFKGTGFQLWWAAVPRRRKYFLTFTQAQDRLTVRHRKEWPCVRPIRGACWEGSWGQQSSGSPRAMACFQGCSRRGWEECWPENKEIWLPAPACLPLTCCIIVDESLLWMFFPIHIMYKLDYLNFNGLCSFLIQWVFEVKYLRQSKAMHLNKIRK